LKKSADHAFRRTRPNPAEAVARIRNGHPLKIPARIQRGLAVLPVAVTGWEMGDGTVRRNDKKKL
jgi:hypothetical protein